MEFQHARDLIIIWSIFWKHIFRGMEINWIPFPLVIGQLFPLLQPQVVALFTTRTYALGATVSLGGNGKIGEDILIGWLWWESIYHLLQFKKKYGLMYIKNWVFLKTKFWIISPAQLSFHGNYFVFYLNSISNFYSIYKRNYKLIIQNSFFIRS